MSKSKNNDAWLPLFQKYNIVEEIDRHGLFEISSKQINEFREARLMTKFDFSSQLPQIFKDNNLSILPVSRGSYIIGHFDVFQKLYYEEDREVVERSIPHYIESVDINEINSEALAINCAYISGILEDFTNSPGLLPTVSGRMGSTNFSFQINCGGKSARHVEVQNAQIEIDGGYENQQILLLLEAKNILTDDFIIRQLYYPYRAFLPKVRKEIKPVFLTYSNGVFRLREYYFADPHVYNSIHLRKSKSYTIIEPYITREYLLGLLNRTNYIPERQDIPFPQADEFERVVNLVESIHEKGELLKHQIADNYGFVPRQADYYSNAALYLDLIRKIDSDEGTAFVLTETSERLFSESLTRRQLVFINQVIAHRPFGETLKIAISEGHLPSKERVVEIMKATPAINVQSENTFHRRAQTIISWTRWILEKLTQSR